MSYTTTGSWQTTRNTFFDHDACRRTIRESLHLQRSGRKSEQPAGTDFSQNSSTYIVLKHPGDLHGYASSPPRWSWFSPTQCLFSIGHDLHPRIACFPLVTLLILSTAGCICQLHPLGSLQVKAIYYIRWSLLFLLLNWNSCFKPYKWEKIINKLLEIIIKCFAYLKPYEKKCLKH